MKGDFNALHRDEAADPSEPKGVPGGRFRGADDGKVGAQRVGNDADRLGDGPFFFEDDGCGLGVCDDGGATGEEGRSAFCRGGIPGAAVFVVDGRARRGG